MNTRKNTFAEYFMKLEKLQSWIINDLTRATIKAQTNFLVTMGVFNYIEILGGFCTSPGSSCKKRFDFVFQNLFPKPYQEIYNELNQITKGAYDCLRCGMTHEYLLKTYTIKNKRNSIEFTIYGVDDVVAFTQCVLNKEYGIELIQLENGKYHLRIYNPRLIHDLNISFEMLKKNLINDEHGYRDNFLARSKKIKLQLLT